jgi:Kef-type K+ transport system membrane component KefB
MRAAVIIIGFTQLLSLGLSRIRQPRVIAEVIVCVPILHPLPLCDPLM